MTWVRLDDGMSEHPKIIGLSDRAFRAHVRGLCYAGRHLTDGFVPEAAARQFGTRSLTELLVKNVWERAENGYEIHDFLEWNPSRAEVQDLRNKRSEAGRRGGRRSRPPTNHEANGQANASDISEAKRNPVPNPTQPNPTTPLSIVQHNPKVEAPAELTITKKGNNQTHAAAEQLLTRIPNATTGTARRMATFLKRGAVEADFHDAREALRQKQPPPSNPAAWACGIIDERLKARQR